MIEHIQSFLSAHADKIPFLALGTGAQVSTKGIIEAVVIGAVLAALGYVAVIPRLEERITLEFKSIKEDIHEIKTNVRASTNRLRELEREIDRRKQ